MPNLPRYLTPPQVAEMLGVEPAKVRAWIDRGELAAVNVAARACGRPRWRISPEALADWMAMRSAPPRPPARRARRRDPAVREYV